MASTPPHSSGPRIADPKKPRKDRTHWLYIAVIIAIIAGVALGIIAPGVAKQVEFLGTFFIKLIKMIITPVIFCTIVLGIGSVRSAAAVGKAGGLALIYFVTMSTFALTIGLLVGNIIEPGSGLNIEPSEEAVSHLVGDATHSTGGGGLSGMLLDIVPTTFFSAFVTGNILQVLAVALVVGFVVQTLGSQGEPILGFVAHLQKLIFKILGWILWLAPLGAFGAMAAAVGKSGWSVVVQLGVLMLAFYLTCIIFIFVVLGLVLKIFTGLNILSLLKYLGREFLLIFATSSSESALPNLMRKMEHAGVDKSTVGIVVPTGYSFNLDGTAIYLTMSAIFIADAMNMPMDIGQQIGMLIVMIIASKGAAGVSGAGLATLAAGLQSQKPELVGGVAFVMGIDKFMSEARALTNFAGNSVATLLVGQWTGTLDKERARQVLSGQLPYVPAEDDDKPGDFRRSPSVENPAQDRLQPTPQVDLDSYTVAPEKPE
ncbi:cation:dicarboxylase symporter family transporter [Corynebacterium poyangense]|uniref:Cation:dicarboxylase symporter family transporter n=1 Tax=Corynebacterium poyangense TaxID=2684405 RepID=A0A7H0SQY7_9CORY|nr:cation:dicarboxylase symporter family transporter [Corynebacterium poyangense]MBZ8176380.1 cation:dicarboxylase symporter family transporter [Corynebacterium poyangense]QNQ90962.1 cation:dicarboxylase symporter family transporter [Corynebacterium poyangense]